MSRTCVAVVCLMALTPVIGVAEMIDNPEYQNWASFEPGAMAKIKVESEMGGNKTVMVMTHTLKSIDKEQALVETAVTMKVAGQEITQPPQERVIPAKIEKPQKPEDQPDVETEKGEESVTVPAGTFDCETATTTTEQKGKTMTTKIWTCKEVPGGQVKMSMKSDGEAAMTSKGELIEMKKK